MYEDDLVLCGKLEEDLRAMVECFVEVGRRGLKIKADKSKGILDGEEGLEGENLCGWDMIGESIKSSNIGMCFWMNHMQMVPSRREVAGAIRFLGNATGLQFECTA